jgi:hypothetical protein
MRFGDSLRKLRPLITGLALPLALFALAGCGTDTGTVSGIVRYKDKPLPSGVVIFTTKDTKGSGNSPIDENGRYTVSNLPPGKVTITVITQKTILPPAASKEGDKKVAPKEGLKKPDEFGKGERKFVPIPFKYSMMDKSGLTYEVKPGPQEHNIDLK